MPSPSEPDPPDEPADGQLADLLEACLRAERALPGSAARIVQTAPEELRTDLEQLLALGQRLRSVHAGELAPAVRHGLRVRIISRIAPGFWLPFSNSSVRRRVSWFLKALRRATVGRR
jgi:hypothetical protein